MQFTLDKILRSSQGGGTLNPSRLSARVFLSFTLLAVALRLVFLLCATHPEILAGKITFKGDEQGYYDIAKTVATVARYSDSAEADLTARRSPGAILPLAALYAAFSCSPTIGLLYGLLIGSLIVPVLGRLAWLTTGNRPISALSMLLGAAMPTLCYTSAYIGSDAQAILLQVLLLTLLVQAKNGGDVKWCVAVGSLLSLWYLTRTSPVCFLLFFYVLCLVLLTRTEARKWLQVFLLTVSFWGPICAWGLRNVYAMNEFFIGSTVAGEALWEANNPVTAGMALTVSQSIGGVDLYEEAARGSYLGSWVPASYVPGTAEAIRPNMSEMEQYHRYVGLAIRFVREEPGALLRLIGFKVRRIFTAEPYAPSVSLEKGAKYKLKKLLTVVERWFILPFGVGGMYLLFRRKIPGRYHYLVFVMLGLLHVGISYVNARFFLPVTTTLLVPAAVALHHVGVDLLSPREVVQVE